MTTSTEKSYFDLHITGLGYLNRIREVKPKKGDAFLACDIAALPMPPHWPLPSRSDPQGPIPEALSSLRQQETFMITIPGQLAIKTIHGRNGDFNVGRLATSIGEFVVKNSMQ